MYVEILHLVSDFSSISALAYLLWILRELRKELKEVNDKVVALKTEHDTLKELNQCPLVKGARHHDLGMSDWGG